MVSRQGIQFSGSVGFRNGNASVHTSYDIFVRCKKPNINWSQDRKEPARDQDQYPWFWQDGKFTGDRINDYHLPNAQKRAAQAA